MCVPTHRPYLACQNCWALPVCRRYATSLTDRVIRLRVRLCVCIAQPIPKPAHLNRTSMYATDWMVNIVHGSWFDFQQLIANNSIWRMGVRAEKIIRIGGILIGWLPIGREQLESLFGEWGEWIKNYFPIKFNWMEQMFHFTCPMQRICYRKCNTNTK